MRHVILGVLTACLLAGIWMLCFRGQPFSGDAVLVDTGFWSYPRYTITFPQVELTPGKYERFRVRGLPRDPMSLTLKMVQPGLPGTFKDLVDSEPRVIGVHIRDELGREVLGVNAPLSQWHVQQSVTESRLWHTSLRDMSFAPRREYTISIEFSGPPEEFHLIVEPALTGGGTELP